MMQHEEQERPASSKRKRILSLLLIFSLIGILTRGITLAANIRVNTGANIEFGQGVARATACDDQITLTPGTTIGTSNFVISSLRISNINSDASHCQGSEFVFKIYDATSQTPTNFVTAINSVVVYDDGSNFLISDSNGISLDQTYNDSTSFTLNFDRSVSPANSQQIYKTTVESRPGTAPNSCMFQVGTAGWTKLYESTSPMRVSNQTSYTTGYGIGNSDAAKTFDNGSGVITTIRDRMEYTVNGKCYFVDVNYDAWSGVKASDLLIPDRVNTLTIRRNITNLNITSNYPGVRIGKSLNGRLEIWPFDYSPIGGSPGPTPYGDNGKYDYDDTPNTLASPGNWYGSFQVHDMTDSKTVLAWNNQGGYSSGKPEIGFGDDTAVSVAPDWTTDSRLYDAAAPFKMQIFVK
jgi:hypothetical protein